MQEIIDQIRCNLKEKRDPEIVKRQDKVLGVFFVSFFVFSLPEFWKAGQEKLNCCQEVKEPKRKLKFRQISCDTFIFFTLGESLAGGSQKESCHGFPESKACIPCPALNKFYKYACQTVSLGTGTKLPLSMT